MVILHTVVKWVGFYAFLSFVGFFSARRPLFMNLILDLLHTDSNSDSRSADFDSKVLTIFEMACLTRLLFRPAVTLWMAFATIHPPELCQGFDFQPRHLEKKWKRCVGFFSIQKYVHQIILQIRKHSGIFFSSWSKLLAFKSGVKVNAWCFKEPSRKWIKCCQTVSVKAPLTIICS